MTLNLKNKRGIILIAVYLVIVVLLTFSVIFINRTINEKNMAIRQKNIALAFYLAEAGLDRGLLWLRDETQQNEAPRRTDAFDPLGGEQSLGGGTYSISIDPNDNNPTTFPIMRYRINSTSRVADITKTLVNEVQTDTFASYSWFTESERFNKLGMIPLWFIGGDRMQGPMRTNGNFFIKNNPVFTGPVQSSEDFITFFNNGTYINLQGISNPPTDIPEFTSMQFEVDTIKLGRSVTNIMMAAHMEEGEMFFGNTTIILNGDKMIVTNSARELDNQEMDLPGNGALFVANGSLTTNGTLNGQLTMGTSRNIFINNNIRYADDPRVIPNSDDVLGLIAGWDVIISSDAPYDLEVDASIMALYSSFMVDNWMDSSSLKGRLTVYGGIIQRRRGPVGSLRSPAGEEEGPQRVSGYSRDYYYDPRFSITSPYRLSPPYFPTTGDYISLSWKE